MLVNNDGTSSLGLALVRCQNDWAPDTRASPSTSHVFAKDAILLKGGSVLTLRTSPSTDS